jgi:hypothetical protein
MFRSVAASCGILLLVASTSLVAQRPLDADAKEIQAYRLTMPVLKQVVAATHAMVAAMEKDPRYGRVARLQIQIDTLEEKEEPTEADLARLESLQNELAQLQDNLPNPMGGDAKTLDQMEAEIRREPIVASALESVGLTGREYATFTLAFFQAGLVHGMQQQGLVKELPEEVNAENVKFIQENEAAIAALMAQMQRKPQ